MRRTPAEQDKYIAFLKKENFLKHLRQSDDATIARFLGIDRSDLTKSTINQQINAEYDSLSEHEIDQFEAEMRADLMADLKSKRTIRLNRETQPIWSKIRYNHHEETDGFIVGYVDAWQTINEDEEGRVIAQVVGAVIDGKPSVYVVHCDPEARFDEMAKDAIAKCADEVKAKLNETILSGQSVVRRRLIREGTLRTYQVLAWIPGHANGECLAQVKLISGDVNGQHLHSLPQIKRFIPAGLSEDITKRVDQHVTDILNEIQDEREQSQREVPPHA